MNKFVLAWVAGLVTFVPVATYHLLFKAAAYQLPLLLLVTFWVLGYWPCLVPWYKAQQIDAPADTPLHDDYVTDSINTTSNRAPSAANEGTAEINGTTASAKIARQTARSHPDTKSVSEMDSTLSNPDTTSQSMAEKLLKLAANTAKNEEPHDDKAA